MSLVLALLPLFVMASFPSASPGAESLQTLCVAAVSANATEQLKRARAHVEAGDLEAARKILAPLVQRFPRFGLVQLEWAELLEKLDGPIAERERALDAAARLEPRNPRVFLARCRHFDRTQALAQAIESCSRALELRPEEDALALRLGILLSLAGRDAQAIEALRKALARAPRDGVARAHLAETCERTGEIACAQREFEILFDQNPRSALHARRLARFYERHGQPERAQAVLKKSGDTPRPAMRPLLPSRN
ncbi:MAG: tetratricopeptide repeat protein [Myxococcales bacterium]|jgi:tetratricopeptide (TPR) repeat protein|nr:tetratricopeptide repeat protein [Myxococcales bacterium]